MKTVDVLCAILVVVGAINWGLVGVANVDLVAALFGALSPVVRTVYVLVGAAGVYQGFGWRGIQRRWATA